MPLKLTESMSDCYHPILSRKHQNWNLPYRNFLLKYEHRIKDKELFQNEQKIYLNFFYFYILKKLSPKFFHTFLTKRIKVSFFCLCLHN